ncbi:PH domain-containing protein [Natronoglycomyces albus]
MRREQALYRFFSQVQPGGTPRLERWTASVHSCQRRRCLMCHYRGMTVVDTPTPRKMRLRRSGAVAVTAMLALVIASPLGMSLIIEQPINAVLAPIAGVAVLLTPVGVWVWAWRSGVDVTAEGIAVKGVFSRREIPWQRVMGFTTVDGKLFLLLDDSSRVNVAPMREEHLPQVLGVGRQDVVFDEEMDADESAQAADEARDDSSADGSGR